MRAGLTGVTRGICSRWRSIRDTRVKVLGLSVIMSSYIAQGSVYTYTGYATMLMEEGYRRASPKPVHLEATRAFSRDIYLHYGFEVHTHRIAS